MRFLHLSGAVMVAAIWGGNYVSSKVGMLAFPPFLFSALRFALVAAVLLPFSPVPGGRRVWDYAQVALTLCVGHIALMIVSLNMGLNVAGCVIIAQLGVPFSCILSAVFMHDRIGKWRALGLAISFIGMLMIAGNPNVAEHPEAFAIALVGSLLWAVSNIQIKRMGEVPIVQLLAWKSLTAVPMLLLVSALFERAAWPEFAAAPASAWLAVGYTGLCSTVLAYGVWAYLLRAYPVSQVAPFSLLTPLFGIALGQWVFQESLSPLLIAGGAVVIIGVAIITVRRPRLRQINENI